MNVSSHEKEPNLSGSMPTFFLAGYQKTATTWLHACFGEHPEIYVPAQHSIHYLDIHYHRGPDWYRSFFADAAGQKQIGDVTPTYMRFPQSRARMAQLNPEAQVIVALRNPIQRAFSHYWHEKKKRRIEYGFQECLGNNVDIFDDWIAAGFYYEHLVDLLNHFPRDRVLVLLYDDLIKSPTDVLRETFRFLQVDADFAPSMLQQPFNKAWFRPTWGEMLANLRRGRPLRESEYDRGIDPEFRNRLREVYRESNRKLAELLGRDLSHWD